MITEGQKNLKVHFAGSENVPQFQILKETAVKYNLYTAFPFVERMVYGSSSFPIMPCELKPIEIPTYIETGMKHSIQDSGLFSLMFGSKKGKVNKKDIEKWYRALIEHTINSGFKGSCVEVDCQKLFGVDLAWEYRKRIKKDLNNRIINVFHFEDQKKGLERMIEFSDYIAISVPELRAMKKKNYTLSIANFIKNKKPEIDIHLLGCTDVKMLKELSFCSSSDSTSWTSGRRYGYVDQHKVSNVNIERAVKYIGIDKYKRMRKHNNEQNTCITYLEICNLYKKYSKSAGCQN